MQSLIAPAIAAVFILGVFTKRVTPKAGEIGLIVGFDRYGPFSYNGDFPCESGKP